MVLKSRVPSFKNLSSLSSDLVSSSSPPPNSVLETTHVNDTTNDNTANTNSSTSPSQESIPRGIVPPTDNNEVRTDKNSAGLQCDEILTCLCGFDTLDCNTLSVSLWSFFSWDAEEYRHAHLARTRNGAFTPTALRESHGMEDIPRVQEPCVSSRYEPVRNEELRPELIASSTSSTVSMEDQPVSFTLSMAYPLTAIVNSIARTISTDAGGSCNVSNHERDDYNMEDDGDEAIGFTPKSIERMSHESMTDHYKITALKAMSQRDYTALHDLFLEYLLEEAKMRRQASCTSQLIAMKEKSKASVQTNDTSLTSPEDISLQNEEFSILHRMDTDDSYEPIGTANLSPKGHCKNQGLIPIPKCSPSSPLPFKSTSLSLLSSRRNRWKRKDSVTSCHYSKRKWFQIKKSGISSHRDLIIIPTADASSHSYDSDLPSTASRTATGWNESTKHLRQNISLAPIFVHELCRLQKDKHNGEALGTIISAIGKESVMRKIQEKMDLIAMVEKRNATLARVPAVRMPLPLHRKSVMVENNDTSSFPTHEWMNDPDVAHEWETNMVVETRSVISIKMGFMSIQYGLLIHWDIASCTADLIVLRKMCSDSFMTKSGRKINRRISIDTRVPLNEEDTSTDLNSTIAFTSVHSYPFVSSNYSDVCNHADSVDDSQDNSDVMADHESSVPVRVSSF